MKGPDLLLYLWGLAGTQMGLGHSDGTGAGVFGYSFGRGLSISLSRYSTVFQAKIYAILACVYETQMTTRSKKYISICSNSKACLKALHALKVRAHWCASVKGYCMTFLLNVLSGHLGPRALWCGNETADELTCEGSAHQFFGSQPTFEFKAEY
jgi:hypothetical protein